MKKVPVFIFLPIFAVMLTACGTESVEIQNTSMQKAEDVSPLPREENTPENETETGEGEPVEDGGTSSADILITIGDTKVMASLDDSETSRDFLSLLPLTIDMTRFYDREYAGSLSPASLSRNGEEIDDFENGDVTYYVAGNALAIFFDKETESDQGGLIRMGKITSDLDILINLQGDTQMTITLAEEEGENKMAEYDFSAFTNVEITGADLSAMSEEETAVLYQQAKYCQAMTDADTDTMEELVSEDMVFTHMSGRQQTRDEYFADVEDGSLRYFTIGIDSPVVEVDGDVASVTYTSVLNANAYGARGTYRMKGTHWFEKRNGDWISVNATE